MRLFQSIQIERFIEHLILNDRDIIRIYSGFELEKDEIVEVMIQHFYNLGVYQVDPGPLADTLRTHLMAALVGSPELRARREVIRRQIERAREKNRRYS